jgi:hypothetical protein
MLPSKTMQNIKKYDAMRARERLGDSERWGEKKERG